MSDMIQAELERRRLRERETALRAQMEQQRWALEAARDAEAEALANGITHAAEHARKQAKDAEDQLAGTTRAIALLRERIDEADALLEEVDAQRVDAAEASRQANARCNAAILSMSARLRALLADESAIALVAHIQDAAKAEALEHALRTGRRRASDPQVMRHVVEHRLHLVLEPLATFERMLRSDGQ